MSEWDSARALRAQTLGFRGASPHHGPRPPHEDLLQATQSLGVGVGFKPRPTCLQRPSPFASPCGLLDRG